jgi:hypothetical protein
MSNGIVAIICAGILGLSIVVGALMFAENGRYVFKSEGAGIVVLDTALGDTYINSASGYVRYKKPKD